MPKSKLRTLEAEAEVTLGTLLSENTKPPLASASGPQDSGWQRVRSGRLCPEQTCVGSGSSKGSSWAVVHVVWDGLSTGPLRGTLCPVHLQSQKRQTKTQPSSGLRSASKRRSPHLVRQCGPWTAAEIRNTSRKSHPHILLRRRVWGQTLLMLDLWGDANSGRPTVP